MTQTIEIGPGGTVVPTTYDEVSELYSSCDRATLLFTISSLTQQLKSEVERRRQLEEILPSALNQISWFENETRRLKATSKELEDKLCAVCTIAREAANADI